MCEAERNLVAWLDGELPVEEAASVKSHVEACEECRENVAALRRVSEDVDRYCETIMAAKSRRRAARWTVPTLAIAAAAAIALVVALPRNRIAPPPTFTPRMPDAANIVANSAAPIAKLHAVPRSAKPTQQRAIHSQRQAGPHGQIFTAETAAWQPTDSAVQIAIPAEAMFAPGAMPKGLNLVAELRIGPDGSVRLVRLRQ